MTEPVKAGELIPTPRVDALAYRVPITFSGVQAGSDEVIRAVDARDLERELAEAHRELAAERARVKEEAARVCEKRRDARFDEHGIREPDTGAAYYSGRDAAEHDAKDEEDEDCAKAIRALPDSASDTLGK